MVKQKTKRYTLQGIGQSVEALVGMVGAMAVEQTIMKDDISGLKTDVSGLKTDVSGLMADVSGLKGDNLSIKEHLISLDLKTDGIINDARAFRAEMTEFRDDTNRNFRSIHEDLDTVLPDHEVRIAKLEGKPVEALGV